MAAGTDFDIAVIGGGINGAGVAREAAYRGYRVVLLEKEGLQAGECYRVERGRCDCPDSKYRPRVECKHRKALKAVGLI